MTLDIRSQAYLRAPHAVLAEALAHGVLADTKLPFFGKVALVLGHPEIQEVLKGTDAFAVDARNAGHKDVFGMKFLPKSLKIMASNVLTMDDPDHIRLRRLVDEPFRRAATDDLKPKIRETCNALIDDMARTGQNDLVTGLCRELPLLVIFDLLGFTPETREKLHGVMKGLTSGGSIFGILKALTRLKPAQRALRAEFETVRRAPRPGLVSELVHAEADGDRMSDDELLTMVFVLFAAGHETTTHLISSAVYTLLTHEGAVDHYRSTDDDARGIAVDELMRYCTPVQMTKPRYARHDMVFHGRALKRGEMVVALLASGNIDPRVFDAPLKLDLTRRPNRHVGWGGGPHICLGLHLARAEAQAALDCLFDRYPNLSFAADPERMKWIRRPGLRGLARLPVRFG